MLDAARHSQSRGLAPATAPPNHAILRAVTWWQPLPVDGHRAIGQPAHGGGADAPAEGDQRPWAGPGKTQLVDQLAVLRYVVLAAGPEAPI